MTESEIQEFIRQTEKDLQVAKEFLAMWRRRNAAKPSMEPPRSVQTPLIPDAEGGRQGIYGANKQAILKAIQKCPEEYTIYDVEKALGELGSPLARPSISQAMSRLANNKDISLLRKGGGRKPAIYRK